MICNLAVKYHAIYRYGRDRPFRAAPGTDGAMEVVCGPGTVGCGWHRGGAARSSSYPRDCYGHERRAIIKAAPSDGDTQEHVPRGKPLDRSAIFLHPRGLIKLDDDVVQIPIRSNHSAKAPRGPADIPPQDTVNCVNMLPFGAAKSRLTAPFRRSDIPC